MPGRFERGITPFADLAGVTAAVDHLAGLDPDASGSRRQRLLASMSTAERHEQQLFDSLLDGLSEISEVTTYGAAKDRTATAYFNIAGQTPRAVAEHLAGRQVNAWSGDNYAYELTRALGIADSGSAVRAGIVHYNDQSDVDRLLAVLGELSAR